VPAKVKLKSGDELCGVHTVILCTGYHITLPFLSAYHHDNMPVAEDNDTVLVTDGIQMHNLHMDIFCIPDPILIFVGVQYSSATFTLFEFRAMAAAAFLSGKVDLPSNATMREEYQEKVERKGVGKAYHSSRGEEIQYVNDQRFRKRCWGPHEGIA